LAQAVFFAQAVHHLWQWFMRLLIYNIRYGTGGKRLLFPWSGYLGNTEKNIKDIADFIHPLDPDIIGLIEVDAGTFRTESNQAEIIAERLGHYHIWKSKYHDQSHLANRVPMFKNQGNAFLASDTITNERFHYFSKGVKKLVIELEMESLVVFLVHLALGKTARGQQLRDLYDMVKNTEKPHIVAGDFNIFWGEEEIAEFLENTGMINADKQRLPSYPSWKPTRHLDFVLHSPEITITDFQMPPVIFSDHLPIVCDFEL
jgi:endonuclease/exonuclease/phosphatase family metal-dependent hydrolase